MYMYIYVHIYIGDYGVQRQGGAARNVCKGLQVIFDRAAKICQVTSHHWPGLEPLRRCVRVCVCGAMHIIALCAHHRPLWCTSASSPPALCWR